MNAATVPGPDTAVRPMPPRSAWPPVSPPAGPGHPAEPTAPEPLSWPMALGRVTVAVLLVALAGLVLISVAPRVAGWESHVVVSGSMEPRLAPGDVVLTHRVSTDELEPGQVLLFPDPDRPGRRLLHRLVSFDARGHLVTRGDANQSNDSAHVPAASVIGRAEVLIPYIGLPAHWRLQGSWGPIGLVTGVLAAATVYVTVGDPRPVAPAVPTGPAERAGRRGGRPEGRRAGRRRPRRATTTGDRQLLLARGRT